MKKDLFIPFPNLTTERLNLRQVNIGDENEIFMLRSDERVCEFLDRPKATTIDDARQFIHNLDEWMSRNESIMWAITLKDHSKLVGTICLWKISIAERKAEIGYELLPGYQGKGIMQEAIKAVIGYGFDVLKLDLIEAGLDPENLRSLRLLEKNNFIRISGDEDFVVYSLLRGNEEIINY